MFPMILRGGVAVNTPVTAFIPTGVGIVDCLVCGALAIEVQWHVDDWIPRHASFAF